LQLFCVAAEVNTRTTRWLNLTNHLRIHFSDFSTVHKLLDSPKVCLYFILCYCCT
jgi:hypothetical protein